MVFSGKKKASEEGWPCNRRFSSLTFIKSK